MVDLVGQYGQIKSEIDTAIQAIIDAGQFINGPAVKDFEDNLSRFLDVKEVIACGNGTDALQIALMALNLKEGDEVILPAFTYAATAEVIGLLKLKPVMVDVDIDTFNTNAEIIQSAITNKTKVIIPVHLFGQCSKMEEIMSIAQKKNIFVVEDNAQSLGSEIQFTDGSTRKAGTIGHISTTSFYPSKNLGCFGDGGALFTNDKGLAKRIRMICNHGQMRKYHHSIIGVNSRLDSLQAAVLDVKLKKINAYIKARQEVALRYDKELGSLKELTIPIRAKDISHTFHQYTLRVHENKRDDLKNFLKNNGIPTMIYYPIPLYKQEAYQGLNPKQGNLKNTEVLCKKVLSLPIHTEMKEEAQAYIIDTLKSFFN